MTSRCVQLVLQYDGERFAGWQRQPDERTVQGVLEEALERLCGTHVAVLGAGRTDAGVHARGQAAGVNVPGKWTAQTLRRAMNAVLPADVWVKGAYEMRNDFHARYDALSRTYTYRVGTDDEANSPFRRTRELVFTRKLSDRVLVEAAASLLGDHSFRAYAVKGTAPANDNHRCNVTAAEWHEREGGLDFRISANRFLHHMVRFLVGTMLDAASGKRDADDVRRLLESSDNHEVSPPVPPHGLYLDRVDYPSELYLHSS